MFSGFSSLLKTIGISFAGGAIYGWLLFLYLSVGEEAFQESALIAFIVGGGVSTPIMVLSAKLLNQKIPWRQKTSLRMVTGIVSTLLILSLCYLVILPGIFGMLASAKYKIGILILVSAIVFNVIYFAVYSVYQFSRMQILYVENQRQQMELQLQALRSQLSPHFLFNCLNTISALIYRDLGRSEKFIRQLAKTYQYTINTKERLTIPLSRELEFVKAYQFLLSVRFEDQVDIKIEIDEKTSEYLVPPMTIQLLVENAVKHNTISRDQKLWIEIVDEKSWLIVRNNKTKTPPRTPSFKIGLENIKGRYQLLGNRNINVVNGEEDFQIWLPVIHA